MLTFHILNVYVDKTQPRQFKFTFNYQDDGVGTGMANPALSGKCRYCTVVVECIYL